ncbi:TPA: coagulase domain-containing protein, partial [Streptococcus agalactiae]
STLFPFSVWYDKHLDNNDNYKDNKDFKEYIALLNEITRKARLGYQIVNNHKDGEHKDEAEILDILIRDITFVSKDAPGYKYIPNKRIAAKIIEDLDGIINDFFKNTGKDKPSLEKLKDTEFHKKYLNSTEPYSIETNLPSNYKELKEKQIKKLEYGYKKSSKIYTSAHYALYSEEIDAAKELLQKVKIAKDNYNEIKSMNLSPSIFNQYLQLLQIVISSEINLKKALDNTVDLPIENNFNTLDIQYNKLDTAIKSLRKFVTKYKQEVRKATKSYSKKELVNAELTKVISNDNILLDMQAISSNYGSTKKFVYSVKRLPYVPQVIMTTTSNVLMPQKQVEKVKLLTPFTISNKEVLNHDSLVENDAQKQKVEQEKTKSLAPQKGAVKEQTEQKVSGNTQEIEKKSETVATPQQSSVAQTSVQQPAPVQSVVQESKASQEEINAAHDAISAYKSTVNIANTAGVTTAEMTTLINTQTSNLSDVEKALGNNKVNNGAVNVLREDTARLENMIWNRAYQAIEEFNVARNTYNNQIKTETVPVDNDIEAILAGSQAKISHLDNRIGARHMDQAFVASLLEVTEMSKSISSRIKE